MHAIVSDAWGGESCGTSSFIQKYINIRFLAYQASPLCGDKDNESNSNLISCTIREVKIPPQWKAMDTPRSKLKVIKMALKVFREIAWETQSAELYSIVADETKL